VELKDISALPHPLPSDKFLIHRVELKDH